MLTHTQDTDSVMVNQVSHCKIAGEACAEGKRMCDHVNRVAFSKHPPIELAFEKVFENFDLPDKKQYVANKWVYEAKDPVIDLKVRAERVRVLLFFTAVCVLVP